MDKTLPLHHQTNNLSLTLKKIGDREMKNFKETMKEIMTMAWGFVRRNGYTMSEALKVAWANVKLARWTAASVRLGVLSPRTSSQPPMATADASKTTPARPTTTRRKAIGGAIRRPTY